MMQKSLAVLLGVLLASSPAFSFWHGAVVSIIPRPFVMNLATLTGGEGAFINNLKNCGSWTSTAGYAFPLILNADGYPVSTPTNTLSCNLSAIPTADNPEWTFSFAGTGKPNLQVSGTPTIVADPGGCATASLNNLLLNGTNCTGVRVTFPAALSNMGVQLLNSGTWSGFSNFVMVRSDELALFNSGEIFRPVSANTLLANIKNLGVTTLRFLDWNNIASQNNVSQWNFLGSLTSFSYAGTRWEPTVFGATPITGTNTYAGPATSGSTSTYVDGQVYQNIVTNANTVTTPTLAVGGGAAVTIINIQGAALGTSGNNAIAANSLATFVYNAKLNAWIWTPGALQTRVPVQILTALCNKLSVNCWYQLPQLFTQASIASYVAYVRDNLTPTAYFEWSNELFNSSASPELLNEVIGTARSFPDAGSQFKDEFGLQFRTAMGIVTSTWSPRSLASLVRVMPWATFETPSNLLIILGTHLTLDASNNYTAGAATTNYSVAGACSSGSITSGRPVDCVDAFAYAPYYQGAEIVGTDTSYNNTMTDALTAADNYASGNATLMSSALDFVDCDVRGVPTGAFPNCGSRNGTPGGITLKAFSQTGGTYDFYNTLATTWSKYVIQYENGFQEAAPSAARLTALGITTCAGGDNSACSTEFSSLITAYKNDGRFKQLVYDQLQQFMAYGNSRFPAWYTLGPTLASRWSVYGGANFNSQTAFQSYNGIQQFTGGR